MDYAIELILQFKYLILFPIAAIEGPMVSLAVGFLAYDGYLNPWIAFLILIFGDIIPDTIYYYIGRFGNKKNLHSKISVISNNYETIKKMWEKHGIKTMFLGKLAYGLSHFFLMSAGLIKMPYQKFFSRALFVTLFQFGIFMLIGYYLGGSYNIISKYIKNAEILIAVFAIIFFSAHILLIKYSRKKILEIKEENYEKNNS